MSRWSVFCDDAAVDVDASASAAFTDGMEPVSWAFEVSYSRGHIYCGPSAAVLHLFPGSVHLGHMTFTS